ncbi:MAG: hypothetical protein K1X39_12120 [Thermoflexales bacterium]|nr:hypothetical protein [Thermoflexales bacterium]
MDALLRLIRDSSVVLYLVLGGVFIFFVVTAIAAGRDLRRASFRLERAIAQSRITGNLVRAGLMALAGAGVFMLSALAPPGDSPIAGGGVATAVVPTSAPTAVMSRIGEFTPTVIYVGTQISTQAQATLGPSLTATARARPTATITPRPAPTAVGARPTLTPTVAATATRSAFSPVVTPGGVPVATDCGSEIAKITAPTPNERIKGTYIVAGTAVVESGGYYKLELLLPGAAQWSLLHAADPGVTVRAGPLMPAYNFSAGQIPAGTLPLRLVVFKASGEAAAVCVLPITIAL